MKVGQYPSLADLQGIEIKKYRQALGNDKYAEFAPNFLFDFDQNIYM